MVSGAAIVAKRLAENMHARGHSVLVIAASEKGSAEISQSKGFKHVKLRSFKNPLRVGQAFTLWSRKPVRTHLKQFSPDIIRVHDILNLGLTGLKYAQTEEISTLLTIHQLPRFIAAYFPNAPGVRSVVEKGFWAYGDWLLRQYDRTIVPSQTIAQEVRLHIDNQPVVISNSIDLKQFSPAPEIAGERTYLREKYGLDPSMPILLHLGRLDTDKNVAAFIRAAACALEQVESQLLVVGDGCQQEALEVLCSDLSIRGRAHFLGYINPEGELPALYRLATVFATASELETQGIVILEALASGVPVVAFRATCIPELVKDSINGYLVSPGDEDGMGDRMAALLSSPKRASEMGRAGRELVKEHAIEKSIQKYEQLYQEVKRARKLYNGYLQQVSQQQT
jgi:glycosyltransferase involved in cell wall biosynthesis